MAPGTAPKKPFPRAVFGVRAMAGFSFTVLRRTGRPYFYVKFKNDGTGEYTPAISTKQETRAKAVQTASQWLKDGIPSKQGITAKEYTLRDMARKADLAPEDAAYICRELQRRGLLKSYVLSGSRAAVPLSGFLLDFWEWGKSPYIREKLRKSHGIHRPYAKEQRAAVAKYWVPYFEGRLLGEVTGRDVDGFVATLENLPLAPKSKNRLIQAGVIPLRWAYGKELLEKDATAGIVWFSGSAGERQILSPEQAAAVFRAPWRDERARLANMLAMVTGMRAGEIQGLRVQDLGNGCLYVRHSWNFEDGLKTTKNNESRTVEVPFPGLVRELLALAGSNPHGQGMDGFVFWAEKLPGKPVESEIFLRDLRGALEATGMGRESAKAYTFHGWRHYFTAYMKDRVNGKLLKSQTGHKTDAMLEHYAGHAIAGDRERIRTAQVAAFGGLLPVSGAAGSLPVSGV